MTTIIRQPESYPAYGFETRKFFLVDLDKRTGLEEVKKKAFDWGKRYRLGDCLIDHSSDAKQMMLDLKPLQNYRLVYGRELPFSYQQWVLRKLKDFGVDIRYIEFREKEGTSTLRVSPKNEEKGCPKPIAYIRITGENEGIKEYLKLLWVGRKIEKFLAEEFAHESWEEIALLKLC